VVWFTALEHSFFPPDAAEHGADLEALVVVRLRDASRLARAAEQLARSGAFGLLLLDLGTTRIPTAMLTRLTGLAQKHGTAIVFLTHKDADMPSLGSLISLRGEARRKRCADGRFDCELHALKDKRRGPGWRHSEVFHGPAGLR
jgi:recombination protein RecA